jgi:hypothetical protein
MLYAPGSLMLVEGAEHAVLTIALQLCWLGVSILGAISVERGALRRIREQGS